MKEGKRSRPHSTVDHHNSVASAHRNRKSKDKRSNRNNINSKQEDRIQPAKQYQSSSIQSSDQISRDTTIKAKGHFSTFDRMEDNRFKTYKVDQALKLLVKVISENTKAQKKSDEASHQHEGNSKSESTERRERKKAWNEVQRLATDAQSQFDVCQVEWSTLFEELSQQVENYKYDCEQLQEKMDFIKQSSQLSSKEFIQKEKQFSHSLKQISNVYDQNRSQIYNAMNQMELVVHDMKNAREKLNVKHLGNMNNVEKQMEDFYSFLTESGQVNMHLLKSARGETGSKSQDHNLEKTTPRSTRAQLPSAKKPKRGKSTQGTRNEQNARLHNNQRVNIPPLPIRMIVNNNGSSSNRGGNTQLSSRQQQLSSRRGANNNAGGPVTALRNKEIEQNIINILSARISARQQQSARRSNRGGNQSNRSNQGGAGGASGTEQPSDEYLLNPVMLACVAYKTSEFDNQYENDYEGAEQTFSFETHRLKEYAEEYEMLQHIEDEEQRILIKQWLFFQHEREIKNKIKEEKQERQQQQRLIRQQKQQQQLGCTTPRGLNQKPATGHNENEQTLKEPSIENQVSQQNNIQQRESMSGSKSDDEGVHLSFILGVSGIKLDSSLSQLGTEEFRKAQRDEDLEEVDLLDILDVPQQQISGLKTLTEKNLILKVEEDFKNKQELHQENRKVFEWSCSETSENKQNEAAVRAAEKSKSNTLYNNNAMSIVDMGPERQKQNDQGRVVGNLESDYQQEDFSSNNQSILSHSLNNAILTEEDSSLSYVPNEIQVHVPIQKAKKQIPNSIINDYKSVDILQNEKKQISNKFGIESFIPKNQKLINKNVVELEVDNQYLLDIIQERQSEFSNSIGQNGKINSHRSKSRQQTPSNCCFEGNVVLIGDKGGKMLSSRQNSARVVDSPLVKNKYHKEMNILSCYDEEKQSVEQSKGIKRSKSHRQSFETAPNSQRGSKGGQNNNKYKDLIEISQQQDMNHFYSIQVDEQQVQEDDLHNMLFEEKSKFKRKQLAAPSQIINNGNQAKKSLELYDKKAQNMNDLHLENIMTTNNVNKQYKNNNYFENSKLSSEYNQFEESKVEKDEDVDQINHDQQNKYIFKSSSEILLREGQKLYGRPFGERSGIRNQENSQFLNNPHRPELFSNESQILINDSIQFPTRQLLNQSNNNDSLVVSQTQFSQLQFYKNQMTNKLLSNFLSQQTSVKGPGQMTRDGSIGQKTGIKEGIVPQYALNTLSEDTISQMFPGSRMTLQMLQQFYNNFNYNNQAGVLFTMHVTEEINDGFLRNCSTLPSDPNFINSELNLQKINHITQNSMINEQALNKKQSQDQKIGLPKMAYSTEGSQCLKSTNIATRLNVQSGHLQYFNSTKDDQNYLSKQISHDSSNNESGCLQLNSKFNGHDSGQIIQQANLIQRVKSVQRTTKMKTPNIIVTSKPHHDLTNSSNILINSQITRGSSTRTGNAASLIFKGSQDLVQISPAAGAFEQLPSDLFSKNQIKKQLQNQQYASNQSLVIRRNNIKLSSLQRPKADEESFTNQSVGSIVKDSSRLNNSISAQLRKQSGPRLIKK